MKGSMATDNFVVRRAFPIMGMLLIGRKAIICGWVRRVTRRRGWRTAVVGFITSGGGRTNACQQQCHFLLGSVRVMLDAT